MFIDLNFSSGEVAAAGRAADARGEKLVVVPEISSSLRKKITSARTEVEIIKNRHIKAEAELNEAAGKVPQNKAEINRISKEVKLHKSDLSTAEKALTRLKQPIAQELCALNGKAGQKDCEAHASRQTFRNELIRQELRKLKAGNRALTSLVLSGHSNGIRFYGDDVAAGNELTRQALLGILGDFPQQRDSLRSVFLWGCYTAQRGDIEWWKSSYGNLKLVLGFNGKGPKDSTKVGPRALEEALETEAQTILLTDIKAADKRIREFEHANETYLAGAVNSCRVGIRVEPVMLDNTADCDGAEATLKQDYEQFSDCMSANDRCPDPDFNKKNSSALFTYYTNHLNFAHCKPVSEFIAKLPPTKRALALISFETIKANFSEYFKNQISHSRSALKKHGIKLSFPEIRDPSVTRQAIIREIDRIDEALQSSDNSALRADTELIDFIDRSQTMLKNLRCLPLTWITETPDEDHAPKAPEC